MSEPVPNPLLQPTPNGAAERKRSADSVTTPNKIRGD